MLKICYIHLPVKLLSILFITCFSLIAFSDHKGKDYSEYDYPTIAEVEDLEKHFNPYDHKEEYLKFYISLAEKYPAYQFRLAINYLRTRWDLRDFGQFVYWLRRYLKSYCGWDGLSVVHEIEEIRKNNYPHKKEDDILIYAVMLLQNEQRFERAFYFGVKDKIEMTWLRGWRKSRITYANYLQNLEDKLSDEELVKAWKLAKEIKSSWRQENMYADFFNDKDCLEKHRAGVKFYLQDLKNYLKKTDRY